MYYLYYSKFGKCLPCALIKWSASIEKLMWTVWQFQSASRRRNPLLSAHAVWRAWWTERGTFYWGHLWGVFTSKTAFWKYRNRHDMYIIYAWIFICIIHIDVYSCMPLICSCKFVIYDIPMSFLAPPDWCCPADWCHAICTSRPRISKAPFFAFGSGFEGYLDAYKCYRRSTIKKVKAPKRPQQLTIIGGSKGLWEARKDGESWSHSKRKSDDFLDINSSQMSMKYKSFPESEVSWEQKGKYEKVPKYEAQVCFGTAGLEALDEETPTPCRFMWMMFVWPEFREMSRIGSRFEVCMSSRWRRMKERLEVYGQWQLLGSTSRNRWNSLFVFVCLFSSRKRYRRVKTF